MQLKKQNRKRVAHARANYQAPGDFARTCEYNNPTPLTWWLRMGVVTMADVMAERGR